MQRRWRPRQRPCFVIWRHDARQTRSTSGRLVAMRTCRQQSAIPGWCSSAHSFSTVNGNQLSPPYRGGNIRASVQRATRLKMSNTFNGCTNNTAANQYSYGGTFGSCTTQARVIPATSTLVPDPAARVMVVGAPRTCGMAKTDYVNAVRTAAVLDALRSVGASPTTYQASGVSTPCRDSQDNAAVLMRGYAYSVNPKTLDAPFDNAGPSGTVATSTQSSLYDANGGATAYGGVNLATTANSYIVGTPAPAFNAFKNQDLDSLHATTPSNIAAVSGGSTVAVPQESARRCSNF